MWFLKIEKKNGTAKWLKNNKREHGFQKNIGLLLALLAIIISAIISVMLFVHSQWEQEYRQKQLSTLDHIDFSIGNLIKTTRNRLDILIGQYTVAYLLDVNTSEKLAERQKIVQNYFSGDSIVGTVVLFSCRDGRSYTNNQFISSQDFITALQLNTSNIKHLFESEQKPYEFIGISPRESSSAFSKIEKFCMVVPCFNWDDDSIIGFIMVAFDRNMFRNTTGISRLDGNSEFAMINYRNEHFVETRGMFLPEVIQYSTLQYGLNGQYSLSANRDKIQLYSGQEQPEQFKNILVNLEPEYRFFEQQGSTTVLFLGIIAGVLLLFLITSYLKKSHSILLTQKILEDRQDRMLTRSLLSNSESLENKVAKQMLNMRSLEEKMDRRLADLRQSVLTGLLLGSMEPYQKAQNEDIGLKFPLQNCTVVTFSTLNLDKVVQKLKGRMQDEQKLLVFVINNIISEYRHCAVLLHKDDIIAIIGHKSVIGAENHSIAQIADIIISVCKKELEIQLLAGIGRNADDESQIHSSYQESLFALEQSSALSKTVLSYNDALKLTVSDQNYAQLIVMQYQLISACKTEEWVEVVRLFAMISGQVLDEGVADISILKIQLTECMNAIAQQVQQNRSFFDDDVQQLNDMIFRTVEANSKNQLKQATDDFIEYFKNCTQHIKEKESLEFVSKVQRIIEEQYSNQDMSVAFIAEILNTNVKTLSAAYKQKTGKGLLDVIHTKRIQVAKDLLMQSDKSIIEISASTGYDNVNTFIRVFKRYCGTTPGKFREMNK